ncbi:MAG: ATP-binding protein, partial [Candidatus Bathyarchaeota archaeon]|nr:ATP-binding protein [Candidatus Bathyarchaeota archaeon]
MSELDIVGQVVGGNSAEILIREKADKELELGDLLISEEGNSRLLLQVFELTYGSQIPQLGRELMAGITLERAGKDLSIFDSQMRNYVI